jgi:hypothetical protein
MSVPTDFLRLYQELGIAPGANIEEIKRAYRRRVSELHPDRPDNLLAASTEEAAARLQQITAYYNAALQFHRQHGRLPGSIVRARAPTPSEGVPPSPRDEPAPVTSSRMRLYVIVAILIVAALAWFASSGTEDAPSIETPPANDSAAVTESAPVTNVHDAAPADEENDVVALEQSPQGPHKLEVGLTAEEVSRIEDVPVTHDDQRWDYGPSWIMFERGKVVDWYSSPLRPLRHATMHPLPRTHEREH